VGGNDPLADADGDGDADADALDVALSLALGDGVAAGSTQPFRYNCSPCGQLCPGVTPSIGGHVS